jgi:Lar family restriction alleviation protein
MTDRTAEARELVERLRECPFCGEDVFGWDRPDGDVAVTCRSCGARGPIEDSDHDAERAWSQRLTATPPADGEVGRAWSIEDGAPTEWASHLAMTATQTTFPIDTYELAKWLDRAAALRPAQPADLARKVEIAREALQLVPDDITLFRIIRAAGRKDADKAKAVYAAIKHTEHALELLEPHP